MVKISSHQLKMGHQNCINLVLYNNRNKITCMLIDTAIIVLYSVYLHAGFLVEPAVKRIMDISFISRFG